MKLKAKVIKHPYGLSNMDKVIETEISLWLDTNEDFIWTISNVSTFILDDHVYTTIFYYKKGE